MEFTCKYRDASGVLRTKNVSAANRMEVFAKLKAEGINPVSIAAGAMKKEEKIGRTGLLRIGMLIAVVALCAGAVLFLWPEQDKSTVRKGTKATTVKRSNATPGKARVGKTAVRSTRKLGPSPEIHDTRIPKRPRKEVVSVITNSSGFILTAVVDENGKTNIVTETVEPQTFKNPMLQLIAAAIGGAYDSELAPLPPVGPEGVKQLRDALKVEIPDLPGDTEEIFRIKDAVRQTRKEMIELIDDGVSIGEIFTQHREMWNENVKIRREIKQEYIDTLSRGDADAAAEYLHRVNGVFREMGIPELSEGEIAATARKGKN